MKKVFRQSFGLLLFSLLAVGCDDSGTTKTDPCAGVTCSGNGVCVVQYDAAVCNCFFGYHPEDLACVRDPQPCDDVTCSGHGTCVDDGEGNLSCDCDEGYLPEALECIPEHRPCDDVTCSGHGTCVDDGEGNLSCDCDEGYLAEDLECISQSETCGNGTLELGEECDNSDLDGETCASLLPEQPLGELGCSVNCTFDTSGCSPPTCGDNVAQGTEECDGTDLGGVTCDDLIPGTIGTVLCSGTCFYNTSGCIATTGEIGAPCATTSQCSTASATCFTEVQHGLPSGYCVAPCDEQNPCTEVGSKCVNTATTSFCAKTCTLGGNDCRVGYECVDTGDGVGVCWANCTTAAHCPTTGMCDLDAGFCSTPSEDCGNGIDDDMDSDIDCNDADCSSFPNCGCAEDSLNNQTSATSYLMGLSSLPSQLTGYICGPAHQDWFRFTTTNAFNGHISLTFSHGFGDLDLSLRNSVLSEIGSSFGSGDLEEITYGFQATTTYYIVVEGYAGAIGPYTLRIDNAQVEIEATVLANPASGVPGGTVGLGVTLENLGGTTATGVSATLSSTDGDVSITDGTAVFGNIVGGGSATNTADALTFTIAASHVNNQPVSLLLTVTDTAGGSWVFPVSVPVPFARLDLANFSLNDSSGDNDGYADPGESVSLGFSVTNAGASIATGPIGVTVTVDPSSTVSGATLSPTGSTVCSSTNLAVGATVACPSRTLLIPGGASNGQTVVLNFNFTDALSHSWVSQRSIVVGPLTYSSILSAFDPQNDNGTYACDLKDVLAYVDASQTLKVKMQFYSACNLTGIHDIYMYDGTTMITLTLEGNAKAIWTNASGSWVTTTNPASFTITPLSGSSSEVVYSIPVSDIPNLIITGTSVQMFAAVIASWEEPDYNDYAPDSPGGSMPWVTFTW